jgi:hypothetical protein
MTFVEKETRKKEKARKIAAENTGKNKIVYKFFFK